MATIEIRMLGDFEIRVNGKPVLAALGQSRKATALVQYLVLQRGERVPHKVLTDTLGGGAVQQPGYGAACHPAPFPQYDRGRGPG